MTLQGSYGNEQDSNFRQIVKDTYGILLNIGGPTFACMSYAYENANQNWPT